MTKHQQYIEKHFTNELKLLVFLSQDELNTQNLKLDLEKIDWKLFLDLTIKHRVVSHVLKHAKFLAEHIPIPIYEKLIDIRLERSKKSLNFAIHAIRIFQKFEENNIAHCFFKGPLLSLELYKDVGYRNFRDIDVLVNKENVEKAKEIIEDLGFICVYPKIKLTEKQKKVNYTISHHYHFIQPAQGINIELHWNITNPKSFYSKKTSEIIIDSRKLKVSNYELPYISEIDNIVYQASHGSIHQWYRLFWLKDFSILLSKTSDDNLQKAFIVSKNLKLEKTLLQAFLLSKLFFKSNISNFDFNKYKSDLLKIPLASINTKDLSQKGVFGKLKFVLYRLKMKQGLKYYFDLLFRLRTHLTDWEIIKLNDKLFFLYYFLRPFLQVYKSAFKKEF